MEIMFAIFFVILLWLFRKVGELNGETKALKELNKCFNKSSNYEEFMNEFKKVFEKKV